MNPMGAFKLGVMKFNPQAASHHLLNRESQLLSFFKLGGWFQPSWKICASQIGSFTQVVVKITNIWNHHPVFDEFWNFLSWNLSYWIHWILCRFILLGLSQKNYATQIAQQACRHVGLGCMSSVSVEYDPSITRSWWSLEMMKWDNQAIPSLYIQVWCMSNKAQ